MNFGKIKKELKHDLKKSRFTHTMGVVETAVALAERYGCDKDQAALAALLHDCAKNMDNEEYIDLCKSHDVSVTQAERDNLGLLHAKCGAILAKEKYGVEDEEILHAIQVHTTGVPEMNLLDKIIYVSDYIEPNRDKAPNLKDYRQLVKFDLEETMFLIMDDTVNYLNNGQKGAIDPTTMEAYQYYKKKRRGV